MAFLPLLIEFFFRGNTPQPSNFILKAVGYFLVTIGCVIGLYLAFVFLGFNLGSLESTLIFSIILVVGGGVCILIAKRRRKVSHPATDLIDVTKDFLKSTDLKNLLRDQAPKIVSMALMLGFALSQIRNPNSSSNRRR